MDSSEQGPSSNKKRKITIENDHNLTEEELLPELLVTANYGDEDSFKSDDSELEDESTEEDIKDSSASNVPNWSTNPTNMKLFQFSKSSKLLQPISGNNEPVDYFRAIFDEEIVDLIVKQTNHCAEEVLLAEGLPENSRLTRWKSVTSTEMLTFIALILHTGTIRLNRLEDYWKSHPLFNLKCFSQHMSRDRFLVIMRCLRFGNLSKHEASKDELYAVRPIIDLFNNRMSGLYYPEKELSIDESMVFCRGQLVFRQFINNKPNKYGINLYMLTEPNGLILKSLVYKNNKKNSKTKVVLNLLENYLDSGHSVYVNNFYNSFEIADKLTNRNTYCNGTLNAEIKNIPKEVIEKKLEEGETITTYSNNIMVGKWKNKCDVIYITNEHGNQMIEYTDHKNRAKEKPIPVFYYNKFMTGVEHQDQLNSFYPCERIKLKWHKKLGIHFIQLMLINSYLLYKKYSGQNITMYDFRIAVLKKLLHIEVNKTKTPKETDPKDHVISKITTVNDKGETSRKRCRVCSQKKIRKMTLYHCEKCPQQPGLCAGECFNTFHA